MPSEFGPLFDPPPHVRTSATSRKAAESVIAKRPSQRQRILWYVRACDQRGATRPEIAIGTGLSENTVRPRVLELLRDNELTTRGESVERDGCVVLFAVMKPPMPAARAS